MYRVIYFIGFIVRQFLLPNPFAPLGANADLINWIVGGALVPLSYIITGLFYDRGSEPALGSLLFFIVYAINTGITYLICLAYPMIWLMIVIAVAYLALVIFCAMKIRDN